MRLMMMTCALLGAAGLAACQPAEDEAVEPSVSTMDSTQEASAMAPADSAMAPTDPSTGSTPPMNDAPTAPANPDGTMAPGRTPPTLPPEGGIPSPTPQ